MNDLDIEKYMNCFVEITTKKNSKYGGKIDGINYKKGKFHLSNLIILHKDGSFKTVSGNSDENKRWFNIKSINQIKLKGIKLTK